MVAKLLCISLTFHTAHQSPGMYFSVRVRMKLHPGRLKFGDQIRDSNKSWIMPDCVHAISPSVYIARLQF